jgi:hypothetical protein
MDAGEGRWRKEAGVVSYGCELGVGAVLGFGPSVGGMLGSPEGVVLEPVEGLHDMSEQGNFNCFVVIVPVDFHGEAQEAHPVCGNDIYDVEGSEKVFGIAAVCILDAKVVDNEAKVDITSFVSPKAQCVSARGIAILCKVCH